MKRLSRCVAAAAAAATLVIGLAACTGEGAGTDAAENGGDGAPSRASDITVGVAMPTQTSERWIADGNSVREGLEAAGFDVNLQFANDDIPTQQQQIDQMITQGADILIVAPIDGTALANQLQAAADAGIPIIAYDRLIRDTANVDFYVTFDNFQVGVYQANSLLHGLGFLDAEGNETGEAGPFTIELFAGSLDDNNAHFFWDGAMSILQPLIDDGTLVVGSGQTSIEQAAILRWSQETAQRRMEDLLTAHYGGGSVPLHGVLSPFDGISRGIITALQNAGVGPGLAEGLPAITGQDAEIASVTLIDRGVQFSTIFKDTRHLAEQAVIAAQAFAEGRTPEANNTTDYDNGVKIVPAFLLPVSTVTVDDIQSVLIDSGFFTEEQVERGQL